MHSYTRDLIAFVKAREGRWISAIEFEQFGRQAWRTRLSEARLQLQAAGEGTIENRQSIARMVLNGRPRRLTLSEYRYVPVVREPEQLTLHEARG